MIDRGIQHERLNARRQLPDPRPLEVFAAIDLPRRGAAEPAHVGDAGGAPEMARQGRLGDAEVGRAAAIVRVVHEPAFAPDHVVDHPLDGWGHLRTRVEGFFSYTTDRSRCKILS